MVPQSPTWLAAKALRWGIPDFSTLLYPEYLVASIEIEMAFTTEPLLRWTTLDNLPNTFVKADNQNSFLSELFSEDELFNRLVFSAPPHLWPLLWIV